MILGAMLPLVLIVMQEAAPAKEDGTTPLRPRGSPRAWVSSKDYPASAIAKRAFGIVHFRLSVNASGQVSSCQILNTSGFWMLDQHTCKLLTARAKFYPARRNHMPIEATFASNFFWEHGESDKRDWDALVREVTEPISSRVTVKKLPPSYSTPPLLRVRFDSKGVPNWCNVEQTSGNAAIDKVACDQALAQAVRPEMKGDLPRKPDTRMFMVEFVAGPAT